MNTDDEFRRLLTTAADDYHPRDAADVRVLERITSRHKARVHSRWLVAAASVIIVVLVAVAIGSGVGGRGGTDSASSGASSSANSAAGTAGSAAAPAAGPSSQSPASSGGTVGSSPANAVPARSARVVQTGQISLEVAPGRVQGALDRLNAIAAGVGGYLSDAKSDQGSEIPSGSSTLRVPVADFTAVVGQVRKIGDVTSISSQARDVTADYVDLTARINALSQTRATYLTMLTKAATIGDTLAVQQQIQQVQTQIEQLQGQQKVLADSSDLATLAVSVTQAGAPPAVTHHSSGFGTAWHRTVSGFNTVLKAIITVAGPLSLILVLLGSAALLGRLGYRQVQRRRAPTQER